MKKYLSFVFILIVYLNTHAQQQYLLNDEARDILASKTVTYPIRFAVVGDPQPGVFGSPCYVTDSTYANNFVPILNEIKETNPDFVICVGDLTEYGSPTDFEAFIDVVRPLMEPTTTNAQPIPFFSLIGNHDYKNTGTASNYKNYIDTELNYFFDFGNIRFMLIDNVNNGGDSYNIANSTINSLNNWMSEMQSENKQGFVFAHVPLYILSWASAGVSSENSNGSNGPEPNYRKLHNLIKKYNIRAFISGHKHVYAHGFAENSDDSSNTSEENIKGNRDYRDYGDGNVEYFVSGGAAEVLNSPDRTWPSDPCIYPEMKRHWLLFSVDECGNFSVEVHWINNPNNHSNDLPASEYEANYYLSNITEVSNEKYFANQSIKAGNNYVIANNANVEFVAGDFIALQKGFVAEANSIFTARLCGNNQQRLLKRKDINKLNLTQNQYKVFPNPNNGLFTIKCTINNVVNTKILVYNSVGDLIKEKYFNGIQAKIDLTNQPNGVFLLRIFNNINNYQTIIIKQ